MLAQARNRPCNRNGPETKAMDAWLRHALADRFGATLAETVPAELAALVARFEK